MRFEVRTYKVDSDNLDSVFGTNDASSARARYTNEIDNGYLAPGARVDLVELHGEIYEVVLLSYVQPAEPTAPFYRYVVMSKNSVHKGNRRSDWPVNEYDTYEEAEEKARYVAKKWGAGHPGVYILRIVAEVKRDEPPVKVTRYE